MKSPHLSDDRLVEVCLLDGVSIAEEEHLNTCPRCGARRDRLQNMLDGVSDEAVEAADAAFPAHRLHRQHARIMAQIEHYGRPARVIAFPAGYLHEPLVSRTRPSTRWVAAAAVAGLVVGVLAGRFGYDHSMMRPGGAGVLATRAAATPELRAAGDAQAMGDLAATEADEEFLSQIEFASDGRAAAALQPLDELTPLPWEVR